MNLRVSQSLLLAALLGSPVALVAQTANTSQAGTVKAVSGASVTITTDTKIDLIVTPGDGVRLLQLAPGSKDLKSATPITLTDIAPGDRVLVTGHPGDTPGSISAARILLMKGSAVADLHASQSADWTRRGTGGIVKTVATPDISISIGTRTVSVVTTPTTVFRRYAGDSVKFEDATKSSLADIRPGDQLRVRGDRSADGSSITAEEVVSGAFQNIAGVLTAVDATAGTVSLRDLTTKKTVTIHVTGNSDLRNLPLQFAQMYARSHAAGAQPAAGAPPAASPASAPGAPAAGDARPRRAPELSQMLGRLPTQPLTDLKAGEAVLIVASLGTAGQLTAVTMLSGVEPILTATPSGAAPTLSPWSLSTGGGGEGEPGGA